MKKKIKEDPCVYFSHDIIKFDFKNGQEEFSNITKQDSQNEIEFSIDPVSKITYVDRNSKTFSKPSMILDPNIMTDEEIQ